jgi:mannose-6-phosphate isomerase-like protein (cupin superfamily)
MRLTIALGTMTFALWNSPMSIAGRGGDMPARTFDWRDDPTGTVIAAPEVRARFLRREPGDLLGGFHSHEESEGIETWLVLEGAVRFEFEDRTVVATPGQAVVAYPRERHRVSCAGNVPCVYFLTLTPHREPTHTFFNEQGDRLPPRPGVVDPTWQGRPALRSESGGGDRSA